MAQDQKSAREIFSCLYQACDRFLSGVSLDLAGVIPRDPAVRKSVVAQKPFLELEPDSAISKSVNNLAQTITQWDVPQETDGNIKFFWKKLLFR